MGAAWLYAPGLRAQACAIAFDGANSTSADAQSVTLPLLVSGANRFLVVQIGVADNGTSSEILEVTYAGAPLSQVLQTLRPGGGGARQATFALANPALGLNDVIVRLRSSAPVNVGAIDYTGVDTLSPVGAVTFAQNANTFSHSIKLKTTVDKSWIVSNFLWYSATASISDLGKDQTQRWSQGIDTVSTEGDDKPTTTQGSYTMNYDLSSGKKGDIQLIEILPCGQPTATPTRTPTETPTPGAPPSNSLVPDGVFGTNHNVCTTANGGVIFYYNVPAPARVQLSVYNVLGLRVIKLVDEDKIPGVWSAPWQGRNDRGNEVATDVYFVLLRVGDKSYLRKIAVLRGT